MSGSDLVKGITPAGSGKAGQPKEVVWSILGHTYWMKAECDACFIFETLDPPGTFVPPHIHPTQDEFIYCWKGRSIYTWTACGRRQKLETSFGCQEACRTVTTISRISLPAPCSLFPPRVVYENYLISCTISPILRR